MALLLAACVLALASCGYDAPVYGTRYITYTTPSPRSVTVVDARGNAVTSGYSDWNSFYFGNRYHANRYYGGRYYGYNNNPYYHNSSPYYYRGMTIYPPSGTAYRPLSWSSGSAPYPWAF